MALQERRAWIRLVTALAAYGAYAGVVLSSAGGRPLADGLRDGTAAGWERLWIANVIYLCFALSVVVGNLAKVLVYRGSLPQW